ncbi:hypothetical protein BH23PLA1_BH23PLA1_29560 [soil metagenome]
MSTNAFATDEDIAIRALADFSLLCPADQLVAAGTDGSFAEFDRWTLFSSGADFLTAGVQQGQIVRLLKPLAQFRPQGTSLVVEAVGPAEITLRRKGLPAGHGHPPGPEGGLSGVEFLVVTLAPQIVQASEELGQRLGIDADIEGRRLSDLIDLRHLREVTVLTVLHRLYSAAGRDGGRDDRFSARSRSILSELERALDGLKLQWKSPSARPAMTPFRFGTRLTR